MAMRICKGSCHCGEVTYQVKVPERIEVRRCNCSICAMTGFVHLLVNRRDFQLLSGADSLREYRFNTRTARHQFCAKCGVKSFYVPRSHPRGYSVNLNCLELPDGIEVSLTEFDGRNWEDNVHKINHLGM